jgi:hypothetical protein
MKFPQLECSNKKGSPQFFSNSQTCRHVLIREISGSHGGENEVQSLLFDYTAVYPTRLNFMS